MTDTYTTIQGDTWDLIAWRVYGTSMVMDRLIYANWKHRHTFRFPAGVVLEMPRIDTHVRPTNLPPWRR